MKKLEQTKQGAVDLHWLATLLTGRREIAGGVTMQAVDHPAYDSNPYFSTWMVAWSRRLVIARALIAVREDLAASARRTALRREGPALPPRPWGLDRRTPKSDVERALLSMDLFPRAAVLLLVFERVPLKDAAILLDADPELVRKAQAAGVRELMTKLDRMQSWKSFATASKTVISEWEYA